MDIIKKNIEYKSVYNCKNSISDYNLVLFIKNNGSKVNRFGFTSAKKIKLAVIRNRIRRRLREIVRKHEDELENGYDIILMARVNASLANYHDLDKSFNKLIKKKKLFNR